MSLREGIAFETELESDCAPLIGLTRAMLAACPAIRAMRDPTRGGVASVLNELATASGVGVRIDEASIPVRPEVRAAWRCWGWPPARGQRGEADRRRPRRACPRIGGCDAGASAGRDAAVIGQVVAEHPGMVTLRRPSASGLS